MNKAAQSEESGRTLRLLELVHQNGMLTQRELSRKLGIALGLVNISLKRLIQQEQIKVRRLSARRVCYLLTPFGMAEKGRLSAHFLTDSFSMYRNARKVFLGRMRELSESGAKRVVLYGSGPIAEVAFITLQELGLSLVAVVADGESFLGRQTVSVGDIAPSQVDRVLYVGDDVGFEACRKKLLGAGFVDEAVENIGSLLLDVEAPAS
ncbi:MAG: winged helix-turn-helix transcriptional regulator [Leptospirillia bacterium]